MIPDGGADVRSPGEQRDVAGSARSTVAIGSVEARGIGRTTGSGARAVVGSTDEPVLPAGRRRRRPSRGPGSLLEVAVGEFITRGYDATSMEHLSHAAGITKSSFYHHFASKEALLRAALEHALDRLFAILDEPGAAHGTPVERLRHIVRGQVEVLVEDLPYVTLLLRVRGNTVTERWALDRRRTFDAHVAGLVREAVAAGELRSDIESWLAARLLSGVVNSIVEWYRPGRGSANLADAVARAAFDGILPAR